MRGQGADGAAGSNRQGLGEHGEGTGEPRGCFEQEGRIRFVLRKTPLAAVWAGEGTGS